MLKPAIYYKDELDKNFAKFLYSENYYYYTGYPGGNSLPVIAARDDYYQWAIVTDKEEVTGYLAYKIDPGTDTCDQFGLFSFKLGNALLARDVLEHLEFLCKHHHRVEWRVISGNPVVKHYDRFCNEHNGNKVVLHQVTKDLLGGWRDEYIYEIINAGDLDGKTGV